VSESYTKLFSSITESTVWGEPYATRIVWVTFLAMTNAKGCVYGSIPGIARRANVTMAEAEAAIASFLAPDPHSRSKDSDGRRVEEIEGGWRLINHAKYAKIRDASERAEAKREWDRENRPSGHARSRQSDSPTKVRQSDESPNSPAIPTPLDIDIEKKKSMSSDKPTTDSKEAERVAELTRFAVEAYNATMTGLPKVALVNDVRRRQVRRCLPTAREICRTMFDSPRIPDEFWPSYFSACQSDDFCAGRTVGSGSHANWRPDFEYLTRADVMTRIFDRASESNR
jgi:hypothetical protein